jgi:hypothetical protein
LRGDFNLFFREVHGAEEILVGLDRRFFRHLQRTHFFGALNWFAWRARFIAAWLRRTERWRFAARRLDAAKCAAQFINFALVGELLPLGNLDEFQNFVELVNHVLERLGDFRGVRDGLADGGSFGGTKISGLDPRLRTQRFGAAFGATIALWFARKITLRPSFRRARNFSGRFRHRRFRRIGFVRGKISGRFRVRFAKITGGIALVMFGVF